MLGPGKNSLTEQHCRAENI